MNNYQYVLEILNENAGKPYQSPVKISDASEKSKMMEMYQKCKDGKKLFEDMVVTISNNTGMVASFHRGVLDGTRRKIRPYYWGELQDENHLDSPESISIFAEYDEDSNKSRYRISLEIDGNRANAYELHKHNKLLDLPAIEGCIYGLNEGGSKKIYFTKDIGEAKDKIEEGLAKKVQLCVIISQEDTNSESRFIKSIENAVRKIKNAYIYVTE